MGGCSLLVVEVGGQVREQQTGTDGGALPEGVGVSVVMPVLNEERHLAEAVRAVLGQDYGGPVQVVLALGPSRDRTDEVAAALAADDPRVTTVPNPSVTSWPRNSW